MRLTILPGALVGLAVLTLPAFAQGPRGGSDAHRGPPPEMIAPMQAREADDMALLLNLRPAQRPALTAFLQSTAPPAPAHDDARPRPGTAPEGFAQRLDRMTQDSARRSADDAGRIAAARSFYDALDPAQRQAFDALMRLRQGTGPHGPPPPVMNGMPSRP
ncbi:Spy/CpxP family protein refolding chaperone [Sphingomonas sp. HMP9]|uniref:Spy/CpxP family protein refolding chaperone n=1 Tax=Sphingomonas sp. HMP9 TaxID=1517554 RepID=UPI0015964BE0|nr:Spy/CpxP family protein refolding chaperone [Sphingomonas sp. HMP9]